MKIAYFHRYIHHDYVRFTKGPLPEAYRMKKWDRVYVTTLFTFEWQKTREALDYALQVVRPGGKVYTGGILATLHPEWITDKYPTVKNNPGLLNHPGTLDLPGEECVDRLPLDYGILDDIKDQYVYPSHDAYFTYMTRGCGMNCTFCAVKTLEPKYFPYVSIKETIERVDKEFGPKKDLLLMDNNVLRSPKFDQIIDEIKSLGFQKGATYVNPRTGKTVERHVDFNQGLDAFLLDEHKAKRLGELAIRPARIAFDHVEDEEVYKTAIRRCARAGIDHMSNYLLYNGDDFRGKGHQYHADTPEDLYYRMHLTMQLGEELSAELGKRIAIFSFPMRYIPLDADGRGYIGANWNAKYLRAFQCMLIPTQGKGIQGRSFFEADFGKNEADFLEYLAMPESLINRRGHFVEHQSENDEIRSERYREWNNYQILIRTWKTMYRREGRDKILPLIQNNHFVPETLNDIKDPELKKIYFLYLTKAGCIRTFSVCDAQTCSVIRKFIVDEIPFLYSDILESVINSMVPASQLDGLVRYFGGEFIKQYLSALNLFSTEGNLSRRITALQKVNARQHYVRFDFLLLQFLPIYESAGVLDHVEKEKIRSAVLQFDEKMYRNLLVDHIPDLEEKLMKENRQEADATSIIEVIKEQVGLLYKQLSIFDE